MLLGISLTESDYLRLSDEEKLKLLNDAYFRARQMKIRAENFAARLEIIKREPETKVLNRSQLAYVEALYAGIFD